ncbi:hypothetical protein [uncultured Chryseobacterium sp.]|uniref:hypothetical protein n=1 Tax=uncultured Chryseobacterium sp. TaxID=259322 RepID=UPI0025FA93A2|nr:hypothetical protein [uncultured Chryseobacterium sp.]
MTSKTLNTINEKLQNQSEEILKQVLGYLDEILESRKEKNWLEHNTNYQLTEQQKRELDAMKNLTDADFLTKEAFHQGIKEKYGF